MEETTEAGSMRTAIDTGWGRIEFKPDGTIISANKRFLSIVGYNEAELMGKHHRMLCIPEYVQSGEYKNFWSGLALGQVYEGEFNRISKEGKEIWIQASYTPVRNKEGKVIRVIKIATDITNNVDLRIQAESVNEAVNTGWCKIEFETDGTILTANDRFLSLVGYQPGELAGKHHSILCEQDFVKSKEYKDFWSSLASGRVNTGEFKRIAKNGKEVWIQASYTPVRNMHGRVIKIIKIATDITNNVDFRIKAESVHKAVETGWCRIEFETNGTILSANNRFLSLLGYSRKELEGEHHSVLCEPEFASSKAYKKFWSDLANGKVRDGEFKRVTKSGEELWIQASYTPVKDADGKVGKVIKIATDITNKKLLELEALKRQKELKKESWLADQLQNWTVISNKEEEAQRKINLILSDFVRAVNAGHAALYAYVEGQKKNEEGVLELIGTYAFKPNKESERINLGEGLVGQCGYEKKAIYLTNLKDNQIKISSGFTESKKINISLLPIIGEGNKLIGVLEIASYNKLTDLENTLLEKFIAFVSHIINDKKQKEIEGYLKKLEEQTEELTRQQTELESANEELQAQAERLQSSEEELRTQQEELAQSNSELEEKAALLEELNQKAEEKNHELEQARQALDIKAKELEVSGTYKSEFLANMSHELRTPLNSILILSKLLQGNKWKNLNDKQIEYAEVIQKSGSDLLELINEILDLAKVESGKIDLELEQIPIEDLADDFNKMFMAIAQDKDIEYVVAVEEDLPDNMVTDRMRLNQIVKNLLSNAFKFTDANGRIDLRFFGSKTQPFFEEEQLIKTEQVVALSVTDSGIGIPADKLNTVFEAFKQADGSTQRKYGGTGLGLSITKELVKLLGGEIHLESEVNKGTTFTVYLPIKSVGTSHNQNELAENVSPVQKGTDLPAKEEMKQYGGSETLELVQVIPDDRDSIEREDSVLLIVEDDIQFAKILLEHAHEHGFKAIVTDRGDAALKYVEVFIPAAIILDMQLPGIDGWEVLKRLKAGKYANIPVHVMSAMDRQKLGLELGAVEYLVKPIAPEALDALLDKIAESSASKTIRNILVIEDDENNSKALEALFTERGINVSSAYTGAEGLKVLAKGKQELVILDLGLPDNDGIDILKRIKKQSPNIPVIIFTGRDLTSQELVYVQRYDSTTVVLKSDRSHERILDEMELFIHLLNNPSEKKKLKNATFEDQDVLDGKSILIVDDDMRNIYSLETILSGEGVECEIATNGVEAVEAIKSGKQFDAILMDMMMPEMDGYEATGVIRNMGHTKLPIIALTAKAMKGDREKCMEAGVSDYMTKPLDVDKLIGLLKVWLYQ